MRKRRKSRIKKGKNRRQRKGGAGGKLNSRYIKDERRRKEEWRKEI